jgi:hypothetical protein
MGANNLGNEAKWDGIGQLRVSTLDVRCGYGKLTISMIFAVAGRLLERFNGTSVPSIVASPVPNL